MTELIERIGASTFLQVAIEGWNDLVLLILILIMTIGARRDKSDELLKRVKIPLTNELILFFAATFVYNLCNIVDICFGGMPTAFSHYCSKYRGILLLCIRRISDAAVFVCDKEICCRQA